MPAHAPKRPTPLAALPPIWRLRAMILLQVFGFGTTVAFMGVWMKENGLPESTIGMLGTTQTTIALISGMLWGGLADHTGRPGRIAMVGLVLMGLASVWASLLTSVWAFALYAIVMGTAFSAVMNMQPLLAVSVLGRNNAGRGYAFYRMFGSVGWIAATLLLPRLIDGIPLLLRLGGVASCLALVPLLGFRADPPAKRTRGAVWAVLRNRPLVVLYVAVFFYGLATPAIFQFAPIYVKVLAGNNAFVGLFMSITGFAALVGLPLTGILTDRLGTRPLIGAALLAQPLRLLGYALAPSAGYMLLPQLLHFLTWAGLEIAGILFVTRNARPTNKGTAMALYLGSRGLGGLLGASLWGWLAQEQGYPRMFEIAAGAAAVGLVVFVFGEWAVARQKRSEGQAANGTPT